MGLVVPLPHARGGAAPAKNAISKEAREELPKLAIISTLISVVKNNMSSSGM